MRFLWSFAVVAFCLSWVGSALGCPRCASGLAARQQALEAFMANAAILALPFLIVGLVSAWTARR